MNELALVTGGAGFIGSHLVRHLLRAGYRVRVLDDLSSGRLSNLSEVASQIDFIEGSIRDESTLKRALTDVSRVFHLAAMISVVQSVNEPLLCHATNETATLRLLWLAKTAGVRRVVIASSAAIYGENPTLPKVETMLAEPRSPYGFSKRANELYAETFTHLYQLPVVCLRFFNVYGPRQDPKSPYAAAIPIFMGLMRHGKRPTIFGDGKQTRDFVYIDDIVQACLLAATHEKASGIYNVATGSSVTLLDLIDGINAALGTSISPTFSTPRPGDIRHSSASNHKIVSELGFTVTTPLRHGLSKTVAWFAN